jgi:hypothetical protein
MLSEEVATIPVGLSESATRHTSHPQRKEDAREPL